MAILNYCENCNQFVSRKHLTCPNCDSNLRSCTKWRINLPLPNGKRIVRIVDTNITDARNLEAQLKTDIKHDRWYGIKQAPRIKQVAKKLHQYNARKLKGYQTTYWDRHIAPYINDNVTMDQFTTSDIDKILARMYQSNYAPATIRHVLQEMRRLYNWAQKHGLYEGENPAAKIESVKVSNQITNYLNKEQVEALKQVLNDWPNQRAASVVLFALYTGCRQGEIFNLDWKDVDLERKQIFLSDPKGKPVTLPISNKATNVLEQVEKIEPKSRFVFCNRFGKKRTTFGNTWHRIKAKTNLPDNIRFHDLRHTFATHMASSGKVSLFELQKLLNHQSITMTMRYAHHMDSAIKKAVENVDSIY